MFKNPFLDLTRFELGLWLFSACAICSAFMFSGGSALNVVASLIGITALIFVAKGYVLGQVLTVVFAVFYGVISIFFRYYGELITYMGMTAPIAALTAIEWHRHPYQGTREVEVKPLSGKAFSIISALAAAVTFVFYFILRALGTQNLFFSTVSVATSFYASALTLCRSQYYALAYAANDLVLIVLWTLASIEDITYLPMIVCSAMFFANDIYGFFSWRSMHRRQTAGQAK